mmetsp:Transcript_21327/g.26198  ORF Transcript_21327/g.26198 Transcript_21327/m.26198 type:complete len:85 (-) Transcript_21327:1164-1418(-)
MSVFQNSNFKTFCTKHGKKRYWIANAVIDKKSRSLAKQQRNNDLKNWFDLFRLNIAFNSKNVFSANFTSSFVFLVDFLVDFTSS